MTTCTHAHTHARRVNPKSTLQKNLACMIHVKGLAQEVSQESVGLNRERSAPCTVHGGHSLVLLFLIAFSKEKYLECCFCTRKMENYQ